MKISKYFIVFTLLFILIPTVSFAATNDFVAGSNITVSGVTFGSGTTNMLILNNSTTESWKFDSGAFTVTNPGTFKVGSSNSAVKSIQVNKNGSILVCSENTTPGISYATVPVSAGTYTVSPSTVIDCTSLCSSLSNTSSYNSFPTCGASSCNAGYRVSGSGGSAVCVQIGGGGVFEGSVSVTKPRLQTIYPDGKIVYHNKKLQKK